MLDVDGQFTLKLRSGRFSQNHDCKAVERDVLTSCPAGSFRCFFLDSVFSFDLVPFLGALSVGLKPDANHFLSLVVSLGVGRESSEDS